MSKQIQIYGKRLVILTSILVLLITAIGTLPAPKTEAWGTSAPDTGVLRLRIGKDGRTTRIPLRAYYTTATVNDMNARGQVPTITFRQAPIDYAGEDEHSCAGNSAANIRVNTTQWDCDEGNTPFHDSPKTVALPAPRPAPGLPGWFVSDATIRLVDNSGNEPFPSCEGSKNSNADKDGKGGCVDYKFTAQLNNGSNSKLTMDESVNANGFTAWGANNYTIPFGPPPSACGLSTISREVGVIDPDSDNMDFRLQRLSGSSWTDVLRFTPSHGSGKSSRWYDFVPGERYRIRLTGIDEGNTVVLLFPFPTIYGEVAVTCWNVRTTTTVSTSMVTIDPDNPRPASVTWTHTADNQGVTNTAPVNLSYRWSPGSSTSGTLSPPMSNPNDRWDGVVITPTANRTRTFTLTIPANTPPGTQYCQGMRSNRTSFNNSAATPWTNACVTVAWPETKPYFQVLAGDVNTSGSGSGRGSIWAWNSTRPLFADGALGQIAALARGTIAGFPSANGIFAGHNLNFASVGAGGPGNLGAPFTSYTPEFPPASDFPAPPPGGFVSVSRYTSDNVKLVNGNIYISGNIIDPSLSGSTFNLNDLKFTRLVAWSSDSTKGNIYIDKRVTQIDAILQASGVIFTCTDGYATPTEQKITNECRRAAPLRVNGAVSAKLIKLFRSSGNVGSPGPAEIFDYTPLAWLQALSGNGATGNNPSLDAYTSLPPVL